MSDLFNKALTLMQCPIKQRETLIIIYFGCYHNKPLEEDVKFRSQKIIAGASDMLTSIEWTLPPGISAGAIPWPLRSLPELRHRAPQLSIGGVQPQGFAKLNLCAGLVPRRRQGVA